MDDLRYQKNEVYVKRQTANAMTGAWSLRRYARSTSNELNHRDMSGSTYRPGYDRKMVQKRRQSVTDVGRYGRIQFARRHPEDFARKITNQPFTILQGPAGTGKTTVIAVMTAAMAADSAVKCLAPTHKAKTT
jgi:flagellar biosynthesis GTPase FlhF